MNLVDISIIESMAKTEVFNKNNVVFHLFLIIILMIGIGWIFYHYKPKDKRKIESTELIDLSQIRRIEDEINRLGELDENNMIL